MRIAINASILDGPVTGIAKYLIAVICRLPKYKQHTFFLYFPKAVDLNRLVGTLGENVVVRNSKNRNKLTKKLWEQRVLPTWCREDMIDVFWSPAHHLPLFLLGDIKKVVTIHDVVWKKTPLTMPLLNLLSEKILMPLSLKKADKIITVSMSTANDVRAYWPIYENKIVVNYPAFNLPKPETSNYKEHLIIKRNYILFVGTIEPRKNLENLLKAYLQLPEDLRKVYDLVIVGGKGWGKRTELKRLHEQSPERIKFLGYVSECELASLYKNASVFVLPSIYEGFGLPLVEAMYYGVPVITSNCSSMPEVAKDASLKVDPNNIESISNAMAEILINSKLKKDLEKKSKIRANALMSLNSIDKLIEQLESF